MNTIAITHRSKVNLYGEIILVYIPNEYVFMRGDTVTIDTGKNKKTLGHISYITTYDVVFYPTKSSRYIYNKYSNLRVKSSSAHRYVINHVRMVLTEKVQ